jgi:hypothetical protein
MNIYIYICICLPIHENIHIFVKQPADPWFCASCREPPKELIPKPANPSVAWKDIYEKMKQDSSVAANPLEILDLPAPL